MTIDTRHTSAGSGQQPSDGLDPVGRAKKPRGVRRWAQRLDPSTRNGRRRLAGFIVANGIVIIVLWWWWQTSKTTSNPSAAPPPGDVWDGIVELTVGDLNNHTITSLVRVVIAVVVALVAGAALVVLASITPVARPAIMNRILPFRNSMPAFGLAIWGIAWFGATDFSVTFIVTMILLPFSMVTMAEGLRSLDPGLREMGYSLTRNRLAVFYEIELPLLLPFIFSAARLAFGVGFKVALIAEFFGADEGLGLILNRARQTFNPSLVWASILTVVIVSFAVERLLFKPIGDRIARMSGAEDLTNTVAAGG